MSPEGKYKLLPYALLITVVFLLYGNVLSGGFVWDDNLFTSNQVYWNYDFRRIFFSLANGLEYQPIRDLTYLFDIFIWKGSSFGFHLTNLLLFAVVVMLVYKVAESFVALIRVPESNAPNWFAPLLTSLFFAVHPLKSEVVAWITQRNTLLAALFFMLSLLFFLRYLDAGEKRAFVASVAAFSLAIFSKAIVVVLPLLLLFFMILKKGSEWKKRTFWLHLAPFFLLSGAGTLLHLAIARKTAVISSAYYGSFSERLAVALQIPFFYLKKSFLLTDISAFYAENFVQTLSSPKVLASASGLIIMAAVVWFLRKSNPELLLGGSWFAITLLPVSNLFATSPVAADRYLFLPSLGLAFTAAILISCIRLPFKVLVSFCAVIVTILGLVTFRQNRVWHDDITLWSHTSANSPQVSGVWFNLGRAFHKTPHLDMALDAYLRALALDPSNMNALDNVAALFPSGRGSIMARRELVKSLLEQFPHPPSGLALIGYSDFQWQHPDASEELFLYLLSADKESLFLRLALANLYLKLGAFDRAAPIYLEIANSGMGRGEAELGLAAIAAATGNRAENARMLSLAKVKGGVPEELISKMK